MTGCNTVMPIKSRTTYGPNLLDHLAADGAGLAGGQVAVVAVLQVDADLVGGLHLELLHALLGLGDVDAIAGRIVAAHSQTLLFLFREAFHFPKEVKCFPWEYFVPVEVRYEWRVAERVGTDSKSHDFDLRVEGVESCNHYDGRQVPRRSLSMDHLVL